MDLKFIAFDPEEIVDRINSLSRYTRAQWGLMGAQHMVEHLLTVFRISNGKLRTVLLVREETLPKRLAFLRGKEAFAHDIRIKGIPENAPLPLRFADLETARQKLIDELYLFASRKEEIDRERPLHPVFGPLDYDDWVLFHRKHLSHHFQQFGII